MKKYVLTAAVAAALFAVPATVAYATAEPPAAEPPTAESLAAPTTAAQPSLAPVAAPASAASAASAAPAAALAAEADAPTADPVRIVEPGERVKAGKGWQLWLTDEGKHWADSTGFEQFRSVVDGNIDRSRPGVSHQSTSDRSGAFHSGVYYGTTDAARVVLTDQDGNETAASLIELPGDSDWGAWYAHTGPTRDGSHPRLSVSLYDSEGELLDELPAHGWLSGAAS
ncbi:hypothetical protein ACX6XY_29760 [Streptomyces sp. O3]